MRGVALGAWVVLTALSALGVLLASSPTVRAANPDATVTTTATATTTVTATATSSTTATATAPVATTTATVTSTATATATATSTATATATASRTVVVTPEPEPTVTTTETVTPPPVEKDLYETPGRHTSAGRQWMTACEPYSVTHRCWTWIWGTRVQHVGGDRFLASAGWVFNNLTYVASPKSLWVGNPLGSAGSWTDEEGRQWRTECNTAVTGGNGCRSWVTTKVAARTADGFGFVRTEVFNNIVRFS